MIVRFRDTASARSKNCIVDYSPRVSSWEQAKAQCCWLGMDLVKIENFREDRALKSLLATECSKYDRIYHRHLKNGYCNFPPHPKKSFWKKFLEKVHKCIFKFQLIRVRGFELRITNLLEKILILNYWLWQIKIVIVKNALLRCRSVNII